ncbi:MAG: tRNA pseudouridine(55) synthase TruB [Deltaproteobacteria bacterium]|nr:MAG: tRNA pseudouridine(55) synthase TruB [Deltaproteobacteria bacterium]
MSSGIVLHKRREPHKQAKFVDDGVLVLDKPMGLTSHEVVQQVKQKLGAIKVGHCGTLDPFATGVLILLINGATKLSPFLTNQEKTYQFTVVFGVETDTQDSTGRVVARRLCEPPKEKEVNEACAAFTGEIEQTVPRYSAVRLGGQRMYRLARQGVQVASPSRTVRIRSLSSYQLRWPEVAFEVTCSKGTYVRSLGVDLARYFNCSGHVSELRRISSGEFYVGQAVSLEEFKAVVTNGELDRVLIPPAQALKGFPELRVSHLIAKRLRQGGTLNSSLLLGCESDQGWPEGPYKVLDPDTDLVAMVAKSAIVSNDRQEREVTFKTLRVFGTVPQTEPQRMDVPFSGEPTR